MISRLWSGVARRENAEAYLEHLRGDTFPRLADLAGFVDASILQRTVEDGVEFLIVTRWESLRAIGQFAGEDIARAVVPETVQRMMVRYDEVVRHYDVVSA
jgi:heme-degrading monooxygenase HmoA